MLFSPLIVLTPPPTPWLWTSPLTKCTVPVGSSDRKAIFTNKSFRRPRDESAASTLRQWEEADWKGVRCGLLQKDWEGPLQGDVG